MILDDENQAKSFIPEVILKDKKILVIDDDRFLAAILSENVRNMGGEVIFSYTGEDGLAKAGEVKPDIILLDIVLQGEMNGVAVLEALKKNEISKHIPVIVLSNVGNEEDIKRGTERGASDFLIKAKFTIEDAIEKIARLLERRRA